MPISADQSTEKTRNSGSGSGWIDLARESAFDLGPAHVVPATCEIVLETGVVRLQPRVMQVLTALAQANGELASRTTLIERCWAGRAVGDDAVNRCVQILRRIAETDASGIFTIETIPGMGYRLNVVAQKRPSVAEPRQTTRAEDRTSRRLPIFISAGLVLVVLAAAVGMGGARDRGWSIVSSRRIVATPLIERHPAISPDGGMIAYSAGADVEHRQIFVKRIAGGEPLQLTDDQFDDIAPQWSPDASRIAFIARRSGEPCRVFVIPSLRGLATQVGRCKVQESSRAIWSPKGEALLFTDSAAPDGAQRIYRLDLRSGTRSAITNPQTGDDSEPTLSPDGRRLAFRRGGADAASLIVRDLRSGAERRIVNEAGPSGGFAWSGDSHSLFMVENTGQDSVVWSYPTNGGLPSRVANVPLQLGRLAASGTTQLAAEVVDYRADIARPPTTLGGPPTSLDQAKGSTWSPDYAPDGALAMISDRSGENAIWVKPPGQIARQLVGFGTASIQRLTWSPTGDRLAYTRVAPGGFSLVVIDRAGTELASYGVRAGEHGPPAWSPDGRALFYTAKDAQGWRLWRVDLADPAKRTHPLPGNWRDVQEEDGALYGVRTDRPGLWRLGTTWTRVGPSPPLPENWTVFRGALVFADPKSGRLWTSALGGGSPKLYAALPDAQPVIDFDIDPLSGVPTYIARLESDTDIELFTLQRR